MGDAAESSVDLVIPVKALAVGKSRLRHTLGYADHDAHRALVLAIVSDTVAAALQAARVRRVAVVTPDQDVVAVVNALGAISLAEPANGGLNNALACGESFLRTSDPGRPVGALQADLPALYPDELDEAIAVACGRRAICADRSGRGTTLLLAAQGQSLGPRFGVESACAHRTTGAEVLDGPWPTLRCDVDTSGDLASATVLGLGARTRELVAATSVCRDYPSAGAGLV